MDEETVTITVEGVYEEVSMRKRVCDSAFKILAKCIVTSSDTLQLTDIGNFKNTFGPITDEEEKVVSWMFNMARESYLSLCEKYNREP